MGYFIQMDSPVERNQPAVELPKTLAELEKYGSKRQAEVLAAITDRLGNILSPAFGYHQLRQTGREAPTSPDQDLDRLLKDLDEFKSQVDAAQEVLNIQNQPLPTIDQAGPMVDFKYTDYKKMLEQDSEGKP